MLNKIKNIQHTFKALMLADLKAAFDFNELRMQRMKEQILDNQMSLEESPKYQEAVRLGQALYEELENRLSLIEEHNF